MCAAAGTAMRVCHFDMTRTALASLLVILVAVLGKHAFSAAANVEIPVTFKENQFLGKITVGNGDDRSAQEFTVDFNTEYGALWLFSKSLCHKGDCSRSPFSAYDGSRSGAYAMTTTPFRFENFGSYPIVLKASGRVSKDQCKLGSGEKAIVINELEFGELIVIQTAIFQDKPAYGIFGLCLLGEKLYAESPLRSIADRTNLDRVFGFYINAHQSKPGKLVIGGDDEDLMEGQLDSHNVLKNGLSYNGWYILIDKLVLKWKDGKEEDVQLMRRVALPSPSSLAIRLPSSDTTNLNQKIFAGAPFSLQKEDYFDCAANWAALPDVIIVMGGHEYEMKPKDYVVDHMNGNCKSGFTSGKIESPTVVLGQTFLKKFYTRFNFGTNQIQIAKARQNPAADDPVLSMGIYHPDWNH